MVNIRRLSLSDYKKVMNIRRFSKSNEYSKFFASPLQKSGEYSKVFCFSSGLLGLFGPHHARARGSSCKLLRLSGLAQASGTPMRMLAIARTTLKNKRASRSQLSQVVGGSGGGGTKKVRLGVVFAFCLLDFSNFLRFPKGL